MAPAEAHSNAALFLKMELPKKKITEKRFAFFSCGKSTAKKDNKIKIMYLAEDFYSFLEVLAESEEIKAGFLITKIA